MNRYLALLCLKTVNLYLIMIACFVSSLCSQQAHMIPANTPPLTDEEIITTVAGHVTQGTAAIANDYYISWFNRRAFCTAQDHYKWAANTFLYHVTTLFDSYIPLLATQLNNLKKNIDEIQKTRLRTSARGLQQESLATWLEKRILHDTQNNQLTVKRVKAYHALEANMNARDNADVTPLIAAASSVHANADVMRELLVSGADCDALHFCGATALILAASRKKKDGIITLLDAGANPYKQTYDKKTVRQRRLAENAQLAPHLKKDGKLIIQAARKEADVTFFTIIQNIRLFRDPDIQRALRDHERRRVAHSETFVPMLHQFLWDFLPEELTAIICDYTNEIAPPAIACPATADTTAISPKHIRLTMVEEESKVSYEYEQKSQF